jgi:hypothetical protein
MAGKYRPSYAAGNYALELGGKSAGWVNNVSLPKIELEKVESKVGAFVETAKAGGNYKHGNFEAQYSMSETNAVSEWILSLPRKQVITTDGAVIQANQNFDAQRRVDFMVGHVTEFKPDKLTASEGKKPFMCSFKWEAEKVDWSKASGKIAATQGTKHKEWNAANFRLEGLVGETEWITEVELPAATAKIAKESYGTSRFQALHYASIDIGDLKITMSARSRDSHLAYVQKVIRDGKLTSGEYLDLRVAFLDPSLANELGEIQLLGAGLLSYEESKITANEEKVATFSLAFSIERFLYQFKHTTL